MDNPIVASMEQERKRIALVWMTAAQQRVKFLKDLVEHMSEVAFKLTSKKSSKKVRSKYYSDNVAEYDRQARQQIKLQLA